MLAFDDAAHFQEVYDCQELAYEAYNDSIDQLYSGLSDEMYNDLLDSIGFIDETPLIDFEQNFSGYHSYRQYMQSLTDVWLLAGADPLSDPDGDNVVGDLFTEVLFNRHGAVMIGGVIHMTLPNGDQVEILNGDCDVYMCFANDPGCQIGGQNVVTHKGSYSGDCRDNAEERGWQTWDSGKKRIKWRMKFKYSQFLDNHRTFVEMKSLRKKNGKWRDYRSPIGFVVKGPHNGGNEAIGRSSIDCQFSDDYNPIRIVKRRKYRSRFYMFPIAQSYYQMRIGDLRCDFNYGGTTYTHDLGW